MPAKRPIHSDPPQPELDVAALLLSLEDRVEPFLIKWPRHMARAGYLAFTTAKREDCIRSYLGFMAPLWDGLRDGRRMDDFASLLRGDPSWAKPVLDMSQRHRLRGITPEMFIGCFKTLVHSVIELLEEGAAPGCAAAIDYLRRYADAMEIVMLADWGGPTQNEQLAQLDESNRQLTLQRNRFENIFATTSDLVLVTDAVGRIEEANAAAQALLGEALSGPQRKIWEVLSLDAENMDVVLQRHPQQVPVEIRLHDGPLVLELRIAPLSVVSLASSGYLFVLSDVSGHVRQRAQLEARVRRRTADLQQKTTELEEMNITLRHVLSSIESERKAYRQSVAQTVETALLPTLKHLQKADDAAVRRGYTHLLSDQLTHLYEGACSDPRLLSLTPTELKICQFIQSGSRNKEIADSLNLSVETVQTHRKSIRRKLKLSGKSVNLFTFLQGSTKADTDWV